MSAEIITQKLKENNARGVVLCNEIKGLEIALKAMQKSADVLNGRIENTRHRIEIKFAELGKINAVAEFVKECKSQGADSENSESEAAP